MTILDAQLRYLCALGALIPASAQAQQLAGGGAAEVPLLRVLAALAICIAAAAAVCLLIRRFGMPRGWPGIRAMAGRQMRQRHIEIVETRRVSPHAELSLVRCHGAEFLILCSQAEHKVLSRMGLDQAPLS